MSAPSLDKALIDQRWQAYAQAVAEGYRARNVMRPKTVESAIIVAARRLKMSYNTLRDTLVRCELEGYSLGADLPPPKAPPEKDEAQIKPQAEISRSERYDSALWRKRAKDLDAELHEMEQELKRVAGLLDRPANPPVWSMPAKGKPHRAAGLLHLSDWHVGEVVRPEEIAGINEYNPEVFKRRIRRMFAASIEILPRWASDCELVGVVCAMNGDLVSGGIHAEIRETDAMPPLEQTYLATDEACAGIEKLVDKFGTVWVVFTPGNHGRTTEKTHAKRTSALSMDILVGEMVRRHFKDDPRVTVTLADGPDAEYPVFSWNVFQSHGDALGTGGGKGFAGPVLPIARGAKSVEWQAYRLQKRHDLILTAHYHTSTNPARGVLANGSVVGFNEYANRIRAGVEPPQQWLALITERWGIRERCEIQLEDALIERPRVRVPARMGAQ